MSVKTRGSTKKIYKPSKKSKNSYVKDGAVNSKKLNINYRRTCKSCGLTHINCMTPKNYQCPKVVHKRVK